MLPKSLQQTIDFPSIMAVAVHDIKNSLSLLLQSVEHLAQTLPDTYQQSKDHLIDVHYEASRMNTTLVQVLSLYRADMNALPTNIDECFVSDLINELVESNQVYSRHKNINVDYVIDESLSWYLDKDLIFLLLHDVFVNAMRYGAKTMQITAKVENKQLAIEVEDDGQGYPENMLALAHEKLEHLCLREGRTGLGLFFAKLIAQTHKNGDTIGNIELRNSPRTGGSIFKLVLP